MLEGVTLVLGGGGVAGVAWMTGVAAGLADEGIDLRTVDRMLGTSAGATVGAQLWSGAELDELFARQADPARQSIELSPPVTALRALLAASQELAQIADAGERIRRLAHRALKGAVVAESERRAVIAGRLPSDRWPKQHFKVTAVDTETGELRLFDASSGVDLIDAVAASCAVPLVWPPVTIAGRRYVDGGIRSAENIDLVDAADAIVVLSPLGLDAPSLSGGSLRSAVDVLRVKGARVVVIEPDAASKAAIGINALDPATRTPAAHAGREQGRSRALLVRDFVGSS